METQLFKKTFAQIAKKNNFQTAFGGWYVQSGECILALQLQRSNFSSLYYLNIYIYIQGYYDTFFPSITKEIIRGKFKYFFRREDRKYSPFFDQENDLTDEIRTRQLDIFFKEWMVPFTEKALSRKGVIELIETNQLGGTQSNIDKIIALINK